MITNQLNIVDGVNAIVYSSDRAEEFRVSGTVALTSNWAVTYSGTPANTEKRTIRYVGKVTLGGNTITIFGATMPDAYASKDVTISCYYNGSAWEVVMMPDFDESDIVTSDHILALAVTSAKLNNLAVTTAKIDNLAVTTGKLALLSVDSTILAANAVTYAKMQQVTANSLLGNFTAGVLEPQAVTFAASTICARLAAGNLKACSVAEIITLLNVPTLSLTAANIWVGNAGNTATAVAPSGDVSMDNAGAFTVAASSITPSKVGQAVSGVMLTGVVAVKIVEGATLKALLDATTNDLFTMSNKDTVLSVIFVTQTAHGAPATVDIGVDAAFRTAGADANGLVEAANGAAQGKYTSDNATYSGALLDFGQFTGNGNGAITVTSSADMSAGAFVGFAMVTYLPA